MKKKSGGYRFLINNFVTMKTKIPNNQFIINSPQKTKAKDELR